MIRFNIIEVFCLKLRKQNIWSSVKVVRERRRKTESEKEILRLNILE